MHLRPAPCGRSLHPVHSTHPRSPLHAACSMRPAPCSPHHAACTMQPVECGPHHAACSVRPTPCCQHHAACACNPYTRSPGACGALHAACSMPHAPCGTHHAARTMWHTPCRLSNAARIMWPAPCSPLHAAPTMQPVHAVRSMRPPPAGPFHAPRSTQPIPCRCVGGVHCRCSGIGRHTCRRSMGMQTLHADWSNHIPPIPNSVHSDSHSQLLHTSSVHANTPSRFFHTNSVGSAMVPGAVINMHPDIRTGVRTRMRIHTCTPAARAHTLMLQKMVPRKPTMTQMKRRSFDHSIASDTSRPPISHALTTNALTASWQMSTNVGAGKKCTVTWQRREKGAGGSQVVWLTKHMLVCTHISCMHA
eukprot:365510-Chlamydomonas_euryale.AAC.9